MSFYTPPVGNNIEITSEHFSTLDHFDGGGDHNFYLGTDYYTTEGTIDIVFTVDDPANISKMIIDPAVLGLNEIEVLSADFDATNQYTLQWNVADFDQTLVGTYQIGAETDIPVTLYDVADVAFPFAWVDEFNLVVPPAPDWPEVSDLTITIDKDVISPGNPLWAYNADTNPANDDDFSLDNAPGTFDANSIYYSVTSSNDSDCDYDFVIENSDGSISIERTGTVLAGNNTHDETIDFYGYDDSFDLFYQAKVSGEIDVSLTVNPTGLTDTGYQDPPSDLEETASFSIDNTDPEFSGKDVDGFVDIGSIPVLTEKDNQFTFDLTVSEELTDAIDNNDDGINNGWNALVVDKDTGEKVNFNGADVTATITDIQTDDNLTFTLTVEISNLEGDYPINDENFDAVLVLRAPNDDAGNPGRYNDPSYPVHADVFWQDACEAYVNFRIQNAKPVFDYVQFQNYESVTVAAYDADTWNPEAVQGYVKDGQLTIAAIVSGGAYGRSITSNAYADLSSFGLGTDVAFSEWVEFTTVNSEAWFSLVPPPFAPPVPVANEDNKYIVVWQETITASLTDGATIPVALTVENEDDTEGTLFEDTKNINVIVDKTVPAISISAPVLVTTKYDIEEGQTYEVTVTTSDAASGINVATHTFECVTDAAIATALQSSDETQAVWRFSLPVDYADNNTLTFEASVADNVTNSANTSLSWDVGGTPAISNVMIASDDDPADVYFVPGNDLTVSFDLTDPERVDYLEIKLTGTNNDAAYIYDATGDADFTVSHTFAAVNADDAATVTATVTGYVTYDSGNVNLIGNGSTDDIIADTQPVISDISLFMADGTEIDYLPGSVMAGAYVMVTVTSVDDNFSADHNVTLTHSDFTFGAPVFQAYNNDGIFVYRFDINDYVVNGANFVNGYYTVGWVANATSEYGYAATEQTREVVVLQNMTATIYGQNIDKYSGTDPEGWFAPEHEVKAEYTVFTTLDENNINFKADFDEITDNVPEIWEVPDAIDTTSELITITNAGVDIDVTLYTHTAQWTRTPDIQSIWSAYQDGDAIPVGFQYVNMFTMDVVIDNSQSIQVDLEVPQYENNWEYALEDAAFDPTADVFSFDAVPNYDVQQPIELVPDAPNSPTAHFEGRLFLRVSAHDNNGNGVGVDTIILPSNLPADWNIAEIDSYDNGNNKETIYEVIPNDAMMVNNDDVLEFNLGKVEDLVGHYNYDGASNSTSTHYQEVGPTIQFVFVDPNDEANVNLNIATSQLFKIDAAAADYDAYTANETAPYIATNERVGVTVSVEEVVSYESNVDFIEVLALDVEILTDEIDGSVDNWVALTADPFEDYHFYLADNLVATDLADGTLARIKVKYDLDYRVHYTDASTADFNTTYETPEWLDDVNNTPGVVDNTEPNFVALNTTPDYTNDAIFVWSETLGINNEGYVSPDDNNGIVKIYFQDVHEYADATVPHVVVKGLDEFVSAIPYAYDGSLAAGVVVPNDKIEFLESDEITINGFTRNYTDVWVATLDELEIQEPPINNTFAEIEVELTDAVGNGPVVADRMVEVTGDGPIVPIIRTVRVLTDDNALNENILNNNKPGYVQVYVDCAEESFIENAWVTPIADVTFDAYTVEAYDPVGGVNDQIQNVNAQWIVTIPFTAVNFTDGNIVPFEVHTMREPFGGDPMFDDTETVNVVADTNAPTIDNIVYTFDGVNVTITADVTDNTAGVFADSTVADLAGINGLDMIYSQTATWNLTYPADFNEGQTPIDGIITLAAADNIGNETSVDYTIDVQPVITSVLLYNAADVEVNVLPQTMDQAYYFEVSIDAQDGYDHLFNNNVALAANFFTLDTPVRTDFDLATGAYVYRFDVDSYNIDESNFVDGYYVADFAANATSVYNYEAAQYDRQFVVLQNVTNEMYGLGEAKYSGQDPDGWFAPEHDVFANYTVYSTLADIDLEANFDLITDVIPNEWIAPATLNSTDSVVTIVVNGVNVDITMYEHVATWQETPDVQSVWNAYEDGEAIPVAFRYMDMFSSAMIEDNTRSIKVDLEVPQYSGNYYIAHEDDTFDITTDVPTYELIGSLATEATLPLIPNEITQEDEFVGKIYLKVPANDDPGVGINEIDALTITDWTVTFIDHEVVGSTKSAIWEMIPNNDLDNDDVLTFTLPRVEDLVGHYNYGGEGYNATSEHYEAQGPELSFRFISDYSDLDELYIFDFNQGMGTAPYIHAGNRVGINLTLKPVEDSGKATTVTSIEVESVFINSDEIDGNADDSWYELVENAGSYELNDNVIADPTLADGTELRIKYKVVYKITYSDASTSTEEFVSDWVESYKAIVDNTSPEFTTDGIEIWSESLGYIEEGYIVPDDMEGEIKITFTDVASYDDPATKPMVEIDGFDAIIDGAFANPYPVPAEDISFDGTNWVAHLDSLHIDPALAVNSSITLDVTLTDAVGNMQTADRMVEVVDNQYLMPLIVDMKVISNDRHANVPDYYIAEDSPITVTVDVQAAVVDYIEELRLDLSELGVVGNVMVTDIVQTSFAPNTPIFTGTYVLTNPVAATDDITVTAYTKRQPYGSTDVFTDDFAVTVHVDDVNVDISEETFVSTTLNDVNWTLNPDGTATATAVFGTIFGSHPEWNMDLATINNWFMLENTAAGNALLDNPKAADLVEEADTNIDAIADTVKVTWNITAAEINDDLVINVDGIESTLQFEYHVRNIYGEQFVWTSQEVTVDDQVPTFADAYTYGENHEVNRTVVIGQDENVKLHLTYTDVSEVASIEADWSRFGGNVVSFIPDGAKAEETFTMALVDIGVNPATCVHDSLLITITDNVGNQTAVNNLIPTTFIVEDDSFALYIYDNDALEMFGANWYTKDADLQLFAEHTVMNMDTIDNNNDGTTDEFIEGLDFSTAAVMINRNNNNWNQFAHETTSSNDTTFISLVGQYANFTEGKYEVQVDMKNIFDQPESDQVVFFVDQSSPVVEGIQFEDDATEYTMIDNIVSFSNWSWINVKVNDPGIIFDRATELGSGVNDANCALELRDATDAVVATFTTGALVGNIIQFTADGVFEANDLAAGSYKLVVTLEDNVGNTTTYEKAFYYNFEPASFNVKLYDGATEITNGMVPISIEDVFVHVTDVNDIGTVDQVEFELFNAEDTQIAHLTEVMDDTVPYETTWNMMETGIIDYMEMYNVPEAPNNREWKLITTVVSNSGAQTADTLNIQVIDDLGPKPTLIAASSFADGDVLTYDFDNPVNNQSTIVAHCMYDSDGDTIVDRNYPDAWKVDFYIENAAGNVVDSMPNTYMEVGTDNYIAVWNWSELARLNPGEYTIYAEGFDRVNNSAISDSWTVTLQSTGNAWADLTMYDFTYPNGGNTEENMIVDETIFAPINPIDDLANLRLEVEIDHVDEVQSLGFFYEKVNVITGDTLVTAPVLNDTAINPDMPEDVSNIEANQFIVTGNTGRVSVVVQRSIYQPVDYAGNDYNYRFFAVIKDFTGEELLVAGHEDDREKEIRVDYASPVATISVDADDLPFFTQRVENEIALALSDVVNPADEIAAANYAMAVQWRRDDTDIWRAALINAAAGADYDYTFSNWNTNVIDSLAYDLQGSVQVQVTISDERNNAAVTNIIDVAIDNQAPVAPVSAITYVDPELGQIDVNSVDPTAVYVAENSSIINVRVYRDQIDYLVDGFYPASGQNDDLMMPIKLYDTDTNQIVAYDHELDANGDYYEFTFSLDVPTTQNFNFAVVAHDVRNNTEDMTVDLQLQIVNTIITTDILGYNADVNPAVNGWMNIPATMVNEVVQEAIIEYSVNGSSWTPIQTVAYQPTVTYNYQISDDDEAVIWAIGNQVAGEYLSIVPGIHVINEDTGDQIEELYNINGYWSGSHDFTFAGVNETINYRYVIDANNDGIIGNIDVDGDGIIDGNEYDLFKIKSESVDLTHYFYQFDTTTLADGYYTFRINNVDINENDVMNTKLIAIDNTAMDITGDLTILGEDESIQAGTDLTLAVDIDNIGAVDGTPVMYYQYLAYDPTNNDSIWVNIGNQNDVGADFAQIYTTVDPETDGWDNDFDGIIDEADEANSVYYFRAFAEDAAGNMSNFAYAEIIVDASEAFLAIDQVNGVDVTGETIIEIPVSGELTITSVDITNELGFIPPFDEAVTADYQWRRFDEVANAWSGWTNIAVGVPADQAVVWTLASPESAEGAYQVKVIAYDQYGQGGETVASIMLNDENTPSINITAIGTATMVDNYAFIQPNVENAVQISAGYPDADHLATIRFYYSTDNATWEYLGTHDLTAKGTANHLWNIPDNTVETVYYVRVVAEDTFGNNSEDIVEYYVDDTAPAMPIVSLDAHYNATLNALVIADTETLEMTVENLLAASEHAFGDVASIELKFDAEQLALENYVAVGTDTDIVERDFDAALWNALYDGTHDFTITLTDFAGNVSNAFIIYDDVYFDTAAPVVFNFQEINGLTEAVYNDTITFTFDYNDLIGVDDMDDMTASFTHAGVTDDVTVYTHDAVNETITFAWVPSADMQQFIVNNGNEIVITIDVTLQDKLDHASVNNNIATFTLNYGIPALARIMIVRDVVTGAGVNHYIDWSNGEPGTFVNVGDLVGGNEITLYTYVPHLGEEPNNVTYKFLRPGMVDEEANWENAVISAENVTNWGFIDPNFMTTYHTQYESMWDISTFDESGTYKVKVIGHYPDFQGTSESVVEFDIYKDMILPQLTVTNAPVNADGESLLERGDMYEFETTFAGSDVFVDQVKYKYRYVSHDGANYVPISGWMSFGDANGVEQNVWIDVENMPFELTVYPYYLIDYKIQMIPLVKDIYGTELTIEQFVGNGGIPAYAQIQDTVGPVATITAEDGAGNVLTGWIGGVLDQITIESPLTDPSGIDHAELYFDGTMIDSYEADNAATYLEVADPFATNIQDISTLASGTYEIRVVAYDNYNNMSETMLNVDIDNDVPVITDIELISTAKNVGEIEMINQIQATLSDAHAGVNPATIMLTGYDLAAPVVADEFNAGIATWTFDPAIEVPDDMNFITYTVDVEDNVGLTATYTEDFDIDLAPAITLVDVYNETMANADYMKDTDDLKVTVALSDWERIDEMTITLNSDPVQTVNVAAADTVIHVFANVVAAAGNTGVTATVEITTHYSGGNDVISSADGMIMVDNVNPVANITVQEGALEREAIVNIISAATDADAGIASIDYSYRMVGDPAWTAIITTADTEIEWEVPADLEFGADYEFQAIVTDNVGLMIESISPAYEVTDINTDITIATVAGFAPPTGEYPIPTRLHGNVEVIADVADLAIPRVEFWYRDEASSDWNALGLSAIGDYRLTFDTEDEDYTFANDVNEQIYYIGVAPNERNADIRDSVKVIIDNRFTYDVVASTPGTDGYTNGEVSVDFTITTDDEIDPATINLAYATSINPEDWTYVANTGTTTIDGNSYQAHFDLSAIDNNLYNLKLQAFDVAFPTANEFEVQFAENVMIDTIDPEVSITDINGETDFMNPVEVELGTPAVINAAAYDVLGGQVHQVASGIDYVAFYYDGYLISEADAEPFSATLNTIGFTIGDYAITAEAYDHAGNMKLSVPVTVSIVPPTNLQPWVVISGFRFDEEDCNEDIVYAVADQWCTELIDHVRFEYTTDGTNWDEFGMEANDGDDRYQAQFNAEVMTDVTKLRAVAVVDDEDSARAPELAVTYSDNEGGSFIPAETAMSMHIYENDMIVVDGAEMTPYLTQFFENNYQFMIPVDMEGASYEAALPVPGVAGEYTYWAAYWTGVGDVQLMNHTMMAYDADITMNGNTVSGFAGNVYFPEIEDDTLMNAYLADEEYEALTDLVAVNGSAGGMATFEMELTDTPAGHVAGAFFDGDEWHYIMDDPLTPAIEFAYDSVANTGTFDAPLGMVYTVVQYTDITIDVMFEQVDPEYTDDEMMVWTMEDAEFTFFVYDDMVNDAYVSPEIGEFEYHVYLDQIEVPAPYANGYITYMANDLEEGLHQISVYVEKDDFSSVETVPFSVDITEPVIVATGTQLNEENLTVSAEITDAETGLKMVHMHINPVGGTTPIDIDFDVEDHNESTFSYDLTINDIYGLIGNSDDVEEIVVEWTAENNLDMGSFEPVYYTINLTGPSITFTDELFWLNPAHQQNMHFEVTVEEGTTIPNDGVIVDLLEVDMNGNLIPIQLGMTPTPTFNDTIYQYTIGFGQMITPYAVGVIMHVEATNNFNITSESEQTYNIDYAPPAVWALSPVGPAIDNDNDGLYNEDPINGVNEDQDWEDWNNNGIWDVDGWTDLNGDGMWNWIDYNGNGIHDVGEPMEPVTIGEPGIRDEDPKDFLPDTLMYGTDVTIAVGFEDVTGLYEIDGDWYYTGASGIDTEDIFVTLNGDEVTFEIDVNTTTGIATFDAGVLDPGHYVVTASIGDHIGNAGSLAYEFEVVGPAPSVTFLNPNNTNGWWLNPAIGNDLQFKVHATANSEVAGDGVVAQIFTVPGNELIQGPMTLHPDDNETYTVNLNSGIIPMNQTGVRLEVMATNIWW